MIEESDEFILKNKGVNKSEVCIKYKKFNFWEHLSNTIDKYNEAYPQKLF
jgi:hypothetical protein